MVVVPGETPVATPVAGSIEATPGLLLIHVPPAVPSVKVIVPVVQTDVGPDMTDGIGSIVTAAVL